MGERLKHTPFQKTGDGPDRTKKSNKKAKSQPAFTMPKKRSWTKKANPMASVSVDVSPRSAHSESQPSTAKRTGPDDSQEQWLK